MSQTIFISKTQSIKANLSFFSILVMLYVYEECFSSALFLYSHIRLGLGLLLITEQLLIRVHLLFPFLSGC